jgi:hypothetical protein
MASHLAGIERKEAFPWNPQSAPCKPALLRPRLKECRVNDDYERAILRLIERVRGMNEAPKVVTLRRKKLMGFAKRLNDLASELDQPWAVQSDIECEHDKEPAPRIGRDGYPIPVQRLGVSYQATLMNMRLLADSAKRAADSLPNPRQRPVLPFAAMALLNLRYQHSFPRPVLSNESVDVHELQRVCNAAGMRLSPESFRNALSTALKRFDPLDCPPEILEDFSSG